MTKFIRTRTHRFNMGAYEHMEISATVEIDTEELPEGTDPIKTANGLLDDLLFEDIERADEASITPDDNTYLHNWKESL
jgi:hypothetical protein